ncbi:MAG: hypothetical protein A3J63_03050 [Candidatus Moranbacteria bacterium RIFCSPHIGHO2_02_FULL_40_12b]|nr:MAG: hypothetical protein A3J63_03050 [Candidatus Moranbacteria bacterium RIFCSPHIGHO2_02_FULL_40_12b]
MNKISFNAPRLSEVLKIQKLVFGFLKFSEAADNRCSAKLRRGLLIKFVNYRLPYYITKLAISSAQFGRGNFSHLN